MSPETTAEWTVMATRRLKRTGMIDAPGTQLGEIDSAISVMENSLSSLPRGELRNYIRGHLRHLAHIRGIGGSAGLPGGSRYLKSRYLKSRWPGDRQKSVKNFTPVVGTAYWP